MELYTAEKKKRKNRIRLWCVFCAHVCRFLSVFLLDAVQNRKWCQWTFILAMRICTTKYPGRDYFTTESSESWLTDRLAKGPSSVPQARFLEPSCKGSEITFSFFAQLCEKIFDCFSSFVFTYFSLTPLSALNDFYPTQHTHTERRTSWRRHFGPADSQIRPTLRHFSESSRRSAVLGPSRDSHSDDSMTSLTHPMTHSATTFNVHSPGSRHEKIN